MRIVITGANGLVGSRASALLRAQGHHVTGLGRGEQRTRSLDAYVSCELSDEAAVAAAMAAARPETVLHTASMTEVDACEKAPSLAYAANVDAAANVARAAARANAHLVHVSTDYVFDGEEGPYDESARPNPRGVYAVTKFLGEQAAMLLAPGCAIARTAVVFGWPAAARPNFGSWLVGALGSGQQVKLFEDQVVSPSFADSVAEMVSELAVRRLGGVWNTSGAQPVNRVGFGLALCQVFGFDPGLIVPSRLADLKLASPRPLRSALQTGKAAAHLSAQPLALDDAFTRFHSAWRAQS